MIQQEALQLFQRAKDRYAEDAFSEALAMLDQLNATYPLTKNIMYPRALCLARLNRFDEAYWVCNELINRFDHEGARKLLAWLKEARRTPNPGPIPSLDEPALPQRPKPLVSSGPVEIPNIPEISNAFVEAEEEMKTFENPLPSAPPGRLSAALTGILLLMATLILVTPIAARLIKQNLITAPSTAKAPPSQSPSTATTSPSTNTTGLPPIAWYPNYTAGLAARDYFKAPMLLYFDNASNPDPDLEKKVFADPSIRALLAGWILVKTDPSFDTNLVIRRKIGFFQCPHITIIDPEDNIKFTHQGTLEARDLYNKLIELSLHAPPPPVQVSPQQFAAILAIIFIVSFFNLPLYLTLRAAGRLPEGKFSPVMGYLAKETLLARLRLFTHIPPISIYRSIEQLCNRNRIGARDWLLYFGLEVIMTATLIIAALEALGVNIRQLLDI